MAFVLIRLLLLTALVSTGALFSFAQAAADNRSSVFSDPNDPDDRPRTIRDTLTKMQIEKEKKEFQKMLDRSEQAVRLAKELERSLAKKGGLTQSEKEKLEKVEKLAKQIRSDLGGGDDEDKGQSTGSLLSVSEAVRSLRSSTEDLLAELKKTTRFTISASAIQCSNAVLRLARFMRGLYQ